MLFYILSYYFVQDCCELVKVVASSKHVRVSCWTLTWSVQNDTFGPLWLCTHCFTGSWPYRTERFWNPETTVSGVVQHGQHGHNHEHEHRTTLRGSKNTVFHGFGGTPQLMTAVAAILRPLLTGPKLLFWHETHRKVTKTTCPKVENRGDSTEKRPFFLLAGLRVLAKNAFCVNFQGTLFSCQHQNCIKRSLMNCSKQLETSFSSVNVIWWANLHVLQRQVKTVSRVRHSKTC